MEVLEHASSTLQQLRNHNASLLVSGEFSDAIITCGKTNFKVHRAVLCRSEYFAKAFKGQFKEAKSAVICLYEDPVQAIISIILYLYCYDFELGDPVQSLEPGYKKVVRTWVQQLVPDWEPGRSHHSPKYHLQAYIAADKYMLAGMKEGVLDWFNEYFVLSYRHMDDFNEKGAFQRDMIEAIPLFYHDSVPVHLRFSLVCCIHSYQQHLASMEEAGLRRVIAELPDFAWDLGLDVT